MTTSFQDLFNQLAHGLLTELPSQLVTAGIAAAVAGVLRARRRRRPADEASTKE
ncbi:hypothetical protein ACFWG6_29075 [Streptomyces erythrochromogenes]|uniref:hypothetical protein n=1 Tax=Streptomyces erythrochromogenes TaxID=285574 RepID=UPI003631F7A7